ncbi:hypothetical protein MBLNU457_g0509t2 [Dothideomycetes sp. NU457]
MTDDNNVHHLGDSQGTSEPWFPHHRTSESQRRPSHSNRRPSTLSITPSEDGGKNPFHWWKFTLRPWDDDQEADWWFASTAIPLIAAALGPLANVLSIAALVKADLSRCYNLNVVSLVAGFVGNLFLLFNFTGRVRYIIALPVTILMWYAATGILIGITVSMHIYVGPQRPQQTFSQGFWYAVFAAIVYLVSSMMLMVNMLGYFLGHYPQHFNLTDSQRTLILQTMMLFIWLAGGGGVFSRVESTYGTGEYNWSFVNALYFADVTILTIGFGDIVATSDVGRGLVFPYAVGGIIILGLVISSLSRFAGEIGSDNIVHKHVERSRARTYERSTTMEIADEPPITSPFRAGRRPSISSPIRNDPSSPALRFVDDKEAEKERARQRDSFPIQALRRVATATLPPLRLNRSRTMILREGRDRFNAMRTIQLKTSHFKQWTALAMSSLAFGILWCVGALIFWQAEKNTLEMTYFEGLYLCFVSLLTIGYGDFAPKSNVGRPFFVLWSLIAVPTMTVLVSDLGDTVITRFKNWTSVFADFTVLPKSGLWHEFLEHTPWLRKWLEERQARKEAERRLSRGFETGPEEDEEAIERKPTIEKLAQEQDRKPSDTELARKLAQAIRQVANDMKDGRERYDYEEWVQFTQLIRFTKADRVEGDEEDLIEWDWIGENSPMMFRISEPEFVLDRLCESMGRYIRRLNPGSTSVQGMHEGFENQTASKAKPGRDSTDSSDTRGRSPGDARNKAKGKDTEGDNEGEFERLDRGRGIDARRRKTGDALDDEDDS